MPASFHIETRPTCLLRFSGVVLHSEFLAVQSQLGTEIDAGVKPRILALLENFQGWERGVDWNDLDFLFSHSNEIAKIAIVGDPRWEAEALAFAGAGFRQAPVEFFSAGKMVEARAWLAA